MYLIQPVRASLACGLVLLCLNDTRSGQDKPAPPTGRFRGEILDPVKQDVIMKVALQAPDKLPAQKHLGLLLLFHGYNGNENNYIGLTVQALKRLELTDRYVVISGKSKGPGWTVEDDARVLRLMAWAKESYPIDPRRVFLFGSSNGAAFVGRFGSEHHDVVAGVIGYCGNYKFSKDMKAANAADTKTEWYFVHGGKDNPQNSRRACTELKANGYRYVFRQMDGYGHTDIWDSGGHPDSKAADAVRDDWLLWLHALRHKEMTPSEGEQMALKEALQAIQDGKVAKADTFLGEAARIGGPVGGKVTLAALAAPDAPVRTAAVQTADKTLYGRDVVNALVKLLDDPAEVLRHAAIKSLASAANWRYDEAQQALCRKARSATTAPTERALAVEALGKAARLTLLGNLEDKHLVWTLVLLLDDEEQRVREAAFASLEKGVANTFEYKPTLAAAERKAAVEKWKVWCTEKCGPLVSEK